MATGGQPEGSLLVFGSFPPVAGAVTAATLAAARRAAASGVVTHTASARASGAGHIARVAGVAGGWRLDRLRRSLGATALVMAFDDGVPSGWCRTTSDAVAAFAAVASLARAMGRFEHVSLLLATDPGFPQWVLRPLWSVVSEVQVVAGCERLAERLAVPAGLIRVVAKPPTVRAVAGHGVTPVGPPEITLLAMPSYALGRAARRVFGPRFPWVQLQVRRIQNRVRLNVYRVGRRLVRPPAAGD